MTIGFGNNYLLGNAASTSNAANTSNSARTSNSAGASAASLNGQIRQDKQQLDDWTTCVSAKTTKGQAEIQRLSGAISAAEEQVHRLSSAPTQHASTLPSRSIDVWA